MDVSCFGLLHHLVFRGGRFETQDIKDVGSSRLCGAVRKLICLAEATNRVALLTMNGR